MGLYKNIQVIVVYIWGGFTNILGYHLKGVRTIEIAHIRVLNQRILTVQTTIFALGLTGAESFGLRWSEI